MESQFREVDPWLSQLHEVHFEVESVVQMSEMRKKTCITHRYCTFLDLVTHRSVLFSTEIVIRINHRLFSLSRDESQTVLHMTSHTVKIINKNILFNDKRQRLLLWSATSVSLANREPYQAKSRKYGGVFKVLIQEKNT